MVEIKKVTNVDVAQKICFQNNIPWDPEDHVIATMDGDDILQCAVFSYEKGRGAIRAIAGFEDDINLLDGLCRAILNIMDINGVKEVYLSEKYEKLANCVGFKPCESGFYLFLEGFFSCGCCHKTEE